MRRAFSLLAAGLVILVGGTRRSGMDARAGAAEPADRARPPGPDAVQRGGADLSRTRSAASTGARRCGPTRACRGRRSIMRATWRGSGPTATCCRCAARRICRSACTASRSSSARRPRTSPWTRSTGCSAGRSRPRTRDAASPTATPTSRCRSTPTPASPQRGGGALAGVAEAPRLAAVGKLPAARRRRRRRSEAARPAATSTWCRPSPTEPSAAATWVPER